MFITLAFRYMEIANIVIRSHKIALILFLANEINNRTYKYAETVLTSFRFNSSLDYSIAMFSTLYII